MMRTADWTECFLKKGSKASAGPHRGLTAVDWANLATSFSAVFLRSSFLISLSHPITKQLATVRSAVKLEQEQQFLIAKKLQELTGSKNIKLKPVVDESLIGGFIVEYGSSQMDHSGGGRKGRSGMHLPAGPL